MKLNLNNLDKSNWQSFRFDEIAKNISERVDPTNTDLELYIGLEHLDAESIHLKRDGTKDQVKGQKLKCYPGDVIFGKRRAYQRKAALVTEVGICSAHAFVLRAIPEVIDPNLFPFFLHSDQFMHRGIDISVGGLSPTINWKTLKEQEFMLPPKEQQAQIAELLWAIDDMVEKGLVRNEQLVKLLNTEIESRLHGEVLAGKTINEVIETLAKKIKIDSLKNLGIILKGKGIAKSEVLENGIAAIRYGELYTKHHRIVRELNSFILPKSAKQATKIEKNDVLFAGSGETITEIGKSASYIGNDEVYAGGDILIFRPQNMDGIYLGYLMNSQLVRQQLNKYGTGATVMHIYGSDIQKIVVPKIKIAEQIEIGEYLEGISQRITKMDKQIIASKTLQKSLINQVF